MTYFVVKRGRGQRRNRRTKNGTPLDRTLFGFGYPYAFPPLLVLTEPKTFKECMIRDSILCWRKGRHG